MIINKIDNLRKKFIQTSVEDIQDPLSLSFGIRFEYYDNLIQGESLQQGLLNGLARKFFNDRGDTLRVQKLDYFIQMLKYFSEEAPWFLRTITGLESLLEIDVNNGARVSKESNIVISAMDTVDMKMLSMVDAYRSIVYDKKFMRDLLPLNLRKFNCSVYVTDPRILLKPTSSSDSTLKVDEDSQGVMVMKCYGCTFDFGFDNYVSFIENTTAGQEPTIRIKMNVDRVYESYNLPTNKLYGYGGVGYYSDDYQNDYNFAMNVLRPPSLMVAEYGNNKDVDRNGVNVFKSEINNVVNETSESVGVIDDTIPYIPIESADNKTTIERLELLTINNVIDIGKQDILSIENKTNIDKINLESIDNKSIIEKLELLTNQNVTGIDKIGIDSIRNSTGIENVDILSNPNNTGIGLEGILSNPNGTSISPEDILSNPNGTQIGLEGILSNPNGTGLDDVVVVSTQNSTSIERLNLEGSLNITDIPKLEIESVVNETEIFEEGIVGNLNTFPLNPTKLKIDSNFLKTFINK